MKQRKHRKLSDRLSNPTSSMERYLTKKGIRTASAFMAITEQDIIAEKSFGKKTWSDIKAWQDELRRQDAQRQSQRDAERRKAGGEAPKPQTTEKAAPRAGEEPEQWLEAAKEAVDRLNGLIDQAPGGTFFVVRKETGHVALAKLIDQ